MIRDTLLESKIECTKHRRGCWRGGWSIEGTYLAMYMQPFENAMPSGDFSSQFIWPDMETYERSLGENFST